MLWEVAISWHYTEALFSHPLRTCLVGHQEVMQCIQVIVFKTLLPAAKWEIWHLENSGEIWIWEICNLESEMFGISDNLYNNILHFAKEVEASSNYWKHSSKAIITGDIFTNININTTNAALLNWAKNSLCLFSLLNTPLRIYRPNTTKETNLGYFVVWLQG